MFKFQHTKCLPSVYIVSIRVWVISAGDGLLFVHSLLNSICLVYDIETPYVLLFCVPQFIYCTNSDKCVMVADISDRIFYVTMVSDNRIYACSSFFKLY